MQMMKSIKPLPLVRLGDGAMEDFRNDKPEIFIPSPLASLNEIILGAISSELLMIAGQPSQGKTALGMQWAVNAAEQGTTAAVLSMEMGRRALRNRLVASLTGIPIKMLRTREWAGDKQRSLAVEAAEYLNGLPLYVDDRSGLDGQQVYDTLLSWKKQGVGLAVIDYLQQMSGANESRVTQVGDAVRAVKAGAKDADLPVILISSLNRAANSRADGKPRMSDMRDSGDIEFVADTILMFHYPEDDLMEDIRQVDIHVMKQRNGPTGIASVLFNKPKTIFEEP